MTLVEPSPPEPPDSEAEPVETDAALADLSLDGIDWSGADRTDLTLHRVVVTDATLLGASLRGAAFTDVTMIRCDLSAVDLSESELRRVEFRDCRMGGIDLSRSEVAHLRITRAKLDDANFRMTRFDHVVIDESSMVGVDAYEATFVDTRMQNVTLRNADFSKGTARGLDLRTSDVRDVRGVDGLRDVTITADQVIPYAVALFAEHGVRIEE